MTITLLTRGIDFQMVGSAIFDLFPSKPIEYKPDKRYVPEKRGTRSFKVKGNQMRGSNGRKNTKTKDMRHEQRSK
jgi:hypothetical protein